MAKKSQQPLPTEEPLTSDAIVKIPEKKSKKKVIENDSPPIKFWKLYRFCNKTDYVIMAIGTISAIINGVLMPLLALILGSATSSFDPRNDPDTIVAEGRKQALYFLYAGIGAFVVAQLSMTCWMLVGERQTINIRREYFRALLRQEIGYFDKINPNELSTKVANDCQMIWQGIGEKVQTFIFNFVMIITGFTIGFSKGWELSLIMLLNIPLIFIGGSMYMWSLQRSTKRNLEAYEKSGGIAEQALNAIKTVVALGGEEKEVARYKASLDESKPVVVRYGFMGGFFVGVLVFAIMGCFALGLFYGSYLIEWKRWNPVEDRPYSFADVLSILMVNMMASFSISGLTSPLKSFALAKKAGARAMEVIDRESQIDIEDESGEKPEIKGTIEFKDAVFAYPLRPDKQILKGIKLIARPKQKVAFVGESGCGKTTAMQLIERFYELDSGDILFDGVSIKKINLKWLRDNIGYVGQEPALFATSIEENLRFAKPDATEEEIWAALKAANMDEFVRKRLKDGLNTFVGSGGAQLSGGQKQRIAIARAILKNPNILLLDEATSALDRKNEIEIQKTLDEIAENRTTIVIAHRLSTIRNADLIIVFDGGHIVEQGTHDELIRKKGRYFQLAFQQLPHEEQQKVLAELGETEENKIITTQKQENKLSKDESPLLQLRTDGEEENKPIVEPNEKLVISTTSLELKEFKHPGDYEPEMSFVDRIEKAISHLPDQLTNIRQDEGPIPMIDIQSLPVNINAPASTNNNAQPYDNYPESDPNSAPGSPLVKEIDAEKPHKYETQVQKRLMGYVTSWRFLLYIGLLAAMANGSILPAASVLMAHMMQTLADYESPDFRYDANVLSLCLLMLGCAALILQPIEKGVYALIGEQVTTGIRTDVFQKLLRMHMGYFDNPRNSPGALTAKLASDATQVNTLVTTVYGLLLGGVGALITGVSIAFSGSWQLALIGLGMLPIMVLASKFNAQKNRGFSAKSEKAYADANGYLSEAINNLRTVASFAREELCLKIYSKKLEEPLKDMEKKSIVSGAAFGFTEFARFLMYFVIFISGSYFTRDIGLSIQDLFLAMFGIMFGALGAGNATNSLPEAGSAYQAALELFELVDMKSEIDIKDEEGKITKEIVGNIEFRNVSFKYPSRDQYILNKLNLKINASNKIALVGPSGCGKSTVIQLLQRFYDATSGEILLDGIDIRKYNLKHLRQSLGIVSQEPVLFNGTIEDNIKYSLILVMHL